MPQIIVTEFMDENIVNEGFKGRDFLYDPTLVENPDRLARILAETRALVIRNRTQINAELLRHAPKLKVVGRLGVGLDNIDLDLCRDQGIAVCPATGANDVAVAEYVITAALILLRGAWMSTDRMIGGDWPRNALIGREAAGLTLGCIGFGAIARETAKRAIALDMSVKAFDPYIEKSAISPDGIMLSAFDEVLQGSDVISLHTPLNEETSNLMGAAAIGKMKADAILINAARGGIVDEDALARALKSGHLGGAALDVFHHEPLLKAAGQRFAGLKNVLLTPHIAGVTAQSNRRVSRVTVENVLQILDA